NTMRVQNYSEITESGERVLVPHKSTYRCYVKNGLKGELNDISVQMFVHELDDLAWSFALEHLYEPERVRQEVEKVLENTIYQEDMRSYYQTRLAEIETAIKRLTKISLRADEEELAEIE